MQFFLLTFSFAGNISNPLWVGIIAFHSNMFNSHQRLWVIGGKCLNRSKVMTLHSHTFIFSWNGFITTNNSHQSCESSVENVWIGQRSWPVMTLFYLHWLCISATNNSHQRLWIISEKCLVSHEPTWPFVWMWT